MLTPHEIKADHQESATFVFPNGGQVHTVEELLEVCELSPQDATGCLLEAAFEKWLDNIGDVELADCARKARTLSATDDERLRQFVVDSKAILEKRTALLPRSDVIKHSPVDLDNLESMDKKADKVIVGWSFGALAANLLPPPFDMMAVGAIFAKLGQAIGAVYGVSLSWKVLKNMGRSLAKGIAAVIGAGYVGSSLFKYVPGVNLWVALLIQPPIVGAIAYSVGNAFKKYYRIRITEGRDLTPEEMSEMAEALLKEKLS